jgi:hypothetical protein
MYLDSEKNSFSSQILWAEKVDFLDVTSEDQGCDCGQLNQNIDGWSRSVLKRISDGVTNDSGNF